MGEEGISGERGFGTGASGGDEVKELPSEDSSESSDESEETVANEVKGSSATIFSVKLREMRRGVEVVARGNSFRV